jgi:hypothetical protein
MSNFLKGMLHSAVVALLFSGTAMVLKFVLVVDPTWLNLTIGAILTSVYNYIITTQTTVGFVKK